MLAARASFPKPTRRQFGDGLDRSRREIEAGRFTFSRALEDIHMNVESRLKELIGAGGRPAAHRALAQRPGGDRLPAVGARGSRRARRPALTALQRALARQARDHADTVMPGFTHLQAAQPVTFGHHLLAYVEMFGRDRGAVRAMPGGG